MPSRLRDLQVRRFQFTGSPVINQEFDSSSSFLASTATVKSVNMVSAPNSNGNSGPATPTNQRNGAAPLPADQKEALSIIQRDFRCESSECMQTSDHPILLHISDRKE
jgi:hypothetical protein